MKKVQTIFCGLVLGGLLISGCHGRKAAPVTNLRSPSFAPLNMTLGGLRGHVVSAQTNVQAGLEFVRAGDAVNAVPPLENADLDLTAALVQLDVAKSQVSALEAENKVLATAYQKQVAAKDKALVSANNEILKLKNEVTRKLRIWLGSFAGFFLLAGIVSVVAKIYLSFVPGIKIGLACGTVGLVLAFFAINLQWIVLWTGIAMGVSILALIAYSVFGLFKHQPVPGVPAVGK